MTQFLRGTLDVLILGCLRGGQLHGYGLAARIEFRSRGAIELEDGALYQALHRLEERGAVLSEWGHADNGKRARFYRLTAAGRHRLRGEERRWRDYVAAVSLVLAPEGR
jgi:transcriptional regulator